MYKIKQRESGFILTLTGNITVEEMTKFYNDAKIALDNLQKNTSFGCIVEMIGLEPLDMKSSSMLKIVQQYFKLKGMERSAVIVDNPKIKTQLINIAVQTGIINYERYFDVSDINYKKHAVNWVKHGIDGTTTKQLNKP